MTENLQSALDQLATTLPEDIADAYQTTTFATPSNLERSLAGTAGDNSVSIAVNFYAEFLDQGTQFITAQPFISTVIGGSASDVELVLTNAFEQDIDDTINQAVRDGGNTVS